MAVALQLAWAPNSEIRADDETPPESPPPAYDPPPPVFGQVPTGSEEPPSFPVHHEFIGPLGAVKYTLYINSTTNYILTLGPLNQVALDDGDETTSDEVEIDEGSWADLHGYRIYIGTPGPDVFPPNDAGYVSHVGPHIIFGMAGNDILEGGDWNDFIFGGDGQDILRGHGGNDYSSTEGGTGGGEVYGGAGSDFILGSDCSSDRLFGNAEAGEMGASTFMNTIWAPDGSDSTWIEGGSGSDTIHTSSFNCRCHGLGGGDQINLYGFSFGRYHGDYREDGFVMVENVITNPNVWEDGYWGDADNDARPGPDILIVYNTVNACHFFCGPYNDEVRFGGKQNDVIWGQGGADVLDGGPSDDEILGGNDADFIFGNVGNDQLYGNEGADQIWGGSGNDKISGGADGDYIWGDLGAVSPVGSNPQATFDDVIEGGEGNDHIWGEAGDDVIFGGAGSDVVWGGDGSDKIHGGLGADYLYGGNGDDTIIDHSTDIDVLIGGSGVDLLSCWDGLAQNPSNGIDYVRGEDPGAGQANELDKFWLDDGDDHDIGKDSELQDPNYGIFTGPMPGSADDSLGWPTVPGPTSLTSQHWQ